MIRNVLPVAPLRSAVSVSCSKLNAAEGRNVSCQLVRVDLLLMRTQNPAAVASASSHGIATRYYTRVIYQNPRKDNGTHHTNDGDLPEILPQPHRIRSKPVRFLNPWVDLSNVTDDGVLAQKVDSVTRTFGVVAGLMCSLSAAALAVMPSADEDHQHNGNVSKRDGHRIGTTLNPARSDHTNTEYQNIRSHEVPVQRRDTRSMFSSQHVSGTSILIGMGLSGRQLADVYAACCAGSFYSSVCAMGLSAVLNAWLACTPAGGTKCKYSRSRLRSP